MSTDQKPYPYSYPISTDDPGFLTWFRPKLTKMYIGLILLTILFLPFHTLTTIVAPVIAIVFLLHANRKQQSLTMISQPLLIYGAFTIAIIATSGLHLEKSLADREGLFCPLLFSFFTSQECLPMESLYDILQEGKKRSTFALFLFIGYVVGYIHLGIVMLGTISRTFFKGAPYITGYLRKYVCEVIPRLKPQKEDLIHYLCYMGHIEKLQQIFEGGQLVKRETLLQKDRYGRSPMELAGTLEILNLLKQHGAEMDLANEYNNQSLLHIHARMGNIKILDFLIQEGLDIHQKDIKGRSPIDYAKNREVEKFLISKGAKKTYLNKTKILNFLNIPR